MAKVAFIIFSFLFLIVNHSITSAQVMSAMPSGTTVTGRIEIQNLGQSNHLRSFADGLVFAISGSDKAVLGFSYTSSMPEPGYFTIDRLPEEGEIILVAFHPSVKRLFWTDILSLSDHVDAHQRHNRVNIGTVFASMNIPQGSPHDLTNAGKVILKGKALAIQALLLTGWVAERMTTNNNYRFVDDLTNQLYTLYTSGYRVTSMKYDMHHNRHEAIMDEFGPQYRPADWNDLLSYYNNGGDIGLVLKLLGGTYEHFNVTYNNRTHYSPQRAYFASYHNHDKPASYLAHSNINRYLISLGSWYGDRRVLAIKNN